MSDCDECGAPAGGEKYCRKCADKKVNPADAGICFYCLRPYDMRVRHDSLIYGREGTWYKGVMCIKVCHDCMEKKGLQGKVII